MSSLQIINILTEMKRFLLVLVLLGLIASIHSQCTSGGCLGYDPEVASYSAHFASCANLLTYYKHEI